MLLYAIRGKASQCHRIALKYRSRNTKSFAFVINFLYIGVMLLYFGLWLARHYQQAQFRDDRITWWLIAGLLLAGYGLSLLISTVTGTILLTLLATLGCCGLLVWQRSRPYKNNA